MLMDSNSVWEVDEVEVKENIISVNTDYLKKEFSRNLREKTEASFTKGKVCSKRP